MVTREEAAHALVGQPFAFEVRGGLLTVHTSASVKGEQWKQRWQQCMRDVQRGDAVCAEAIQATHMFSGDAYHLLHVKYEDKAGHRVWFRSRLNRERMYDFVARPRLRVPSLCANFATALPVTQIMAIITLTNLIIQILALLTNVIQNETSDPLPFRLTLRCS